LALDGGESSVLCSNCLTLGERGPDTYWIGGWVEHRAGLDAVVRRKIFSPYRESPPECIQRNVTRGLSENYFQQYYQAWRRQWDGL